MSPGTDFNMYQKVTSKTKSNVPITSRDSRTPLRKVLSSERLLGETGGRSKTNAEKNVNKLLTASGNSFEQCSDLHSTRKIEANSTSALEVTKEKAAKFNKTMAAGITTLKLME